MRSFHIRSWKRFFFVEDRGHFRERKRVAEGKVEVRDEEGL